MFGIDEHDGDVTVIWVCRLGFELYGYARGELLKMVGYERSPCDELGSPVSSGSDTGVHLAVTIARCPAKFQK